MLSEHDAEVVEFDLLRFAHAIDKGLYLPERRVGFGRDKIRCILNMLKLLAPSAGGRQRVVTWAVNILRRYARALAKDLETLDIASEKRVELANWLEKLRDALEQFDQLPDVCEGPPSKTGLSDIYFKRRSVRCWKDEDVDNSVLRTLVEAALWAPSSCNRQPYKFLFIRDAKVKRMVLDVATGGRGFADMAPVVLLLLVDVRAYYSPSERHLAYIDAALASQNLALAACELGLGTVWLNCAVEDFAKEDELRGELRIPRWYALVGAMAIGWPLDDTRYEPSVRRSVDDVIVFERFA
ncbi:MAG: nitroreductase family protein [Armatimonadota bacterium]|nr:nitroreductase family protein [Armatimonadota bacterium]